MLYKVESKSKKFNIHDASYEYVGLNDETVKDKKDAYAYTMTDGSETRYLIKTVAGYPADLGRSYPSGYSVNFVSVNEDMYKCFREYLKRPIPAIYSTVKSQFMIGGFHA